MARKFSLLVIVSTLFILGACGSGEEAPPPASPATTNDSSDVVSPSPTETEQTPDSVLFFDDFDGPLDASWSWINEDPSRWRLTDNGWLEITAANPGFVAEEGGNIREINVLSREAPQGSFTLTTRLFTNPDANFNQVGIFMFQDGINYTAIFSGFCDPCLPGIGSGFLMEAFINNEYMSGGMWDQRDPSLMDVYLRLVYDADAHTITGFAGRRPDEWQQIGVVQNFPSVLNIGLGAANAPGPNGVQEDLIASYAYVELSTEDTPVHSEDALP